MRVFVVSHEAGGPVGEVLESHGVEVQHYDVVWASGEGLAIEERRRATQDAVTQCDAVILDLTHKSTQVPAAFVLGIASTLGKRIVSVNDTSAEENHGMLQYTPGDSEAMALFTPALLDRLNRVDPAPEPTKPEVFISYCHADVAFLDRLRVHLRPLERDATINVWSDTRIRPGDLWRKEIGAALERASVAVLLVSADFLASDFIVTNELPPLLKKARANGATILPLIIGNCRFARDAQLAQFQAVNNPRQPLSSLSPEERESYYDQVAAHVESLGKSVSALS